VSLFLIFINFYFNLVLLSDNEIFQRLAVRRDVNLTPAVRRSLQRLIPEDDVEEPQAILQDNDNLIRIRQLEQELRNARDGSSFFNIMGQFAGELRLHTSK
jgi:UDP-N-acetylenolpyruvoylglucosamine reductase